MGLVLFLILALICVISAIGVVAFHNPIHSAMCLILNLLMVAALFAMLDAHFLSTVQVIVYAGAIMVLVIFVLMLLNLKVEKPQGHNYLLTGAAVVIGAGFFSMFYAALSTSPQFPEVAQAPEGTVKAVGELLYTQYVFPFEAASVLLLIAIVGAVMLAKRDYRGAKH